MGMEWADVMRYGIAPFLGALGAYMAIREDLAVIRTRTQHNAEEISKLQAWRDRFLEKDSK